MATSDEFVATIEKKDDLTYKIKTKDRYHPLDAGVIAGIGYRLMKGNGMNLAVRYYYGFVDITIDDTTPSQTNRSLYFAIGIPIGAGKKPDETKIALVKFQKRILNTVNCCHYNNVRNLTFYQMR